MPTLPSPPDDGAPTLADLGEFGLIAAVSDGREQPDTTLLGPGDDAAVVAAPDARVVASTDVLVEGVHFRFDWSTPEQIGRKAAAVNLADIAAMGAVPSSLLVGLACPPETPVATLTALADGMWEEARSAGAGIVGGDMTGGPVLMISITVLGSLDGRPPVTRSGARPGDVVALCGRTGFAAAGLAVLSRGFRSPKSMVDAQRTPHPPYTAGPAAARAGATAMIDVSDGLLADLGHIAKASGVHIDVRRPEVPTRLVDVGSALGIDPVHWMLTGGEDHALAATFPPDVALPEGWAAIGTVADGDPAVTVAGKPYVEGPAGWDHFGRR